MQAERTFLTRAQESMAADGARRRGVCVQSERLGLILYVSVASTVTSIESLFTHFVRCPDNKCVLKDIWMIQ